MSVIISFTDLISFQSRVSFSVSLQCSEEQFHAVQRKKLLLRMAFYVFGLKGDSAPPCCRLNFVETEKRIYHSLWRDDYTCIYCLQKDTLFIFSSVIQKQKNNWKEQKSTHAADGSNIQYPSHMGSVTLYNMTHFVYHSKRTRNSVQPKEYCWCRC